MVPLSELLQHKFKFFYVMFLDRKNDQYGFYAATNRIKPMVIADIPIYTRHAIQYIDLKVKELSGNLFDLKIIDVILQSACLLHEDTLLIMIPWKDYKVLLEAHHLSYLKGNNDNYRLIWYSFKDLEFLSRNSLDIEMPLEKRIYRTKIYPKSISRTSDKILWSTFDVSGQQRRNRYGVIGSHIVSQNFNIFPQITSTLRYFCRILTSN